MLTDIGDIELRVRRARAGTFEPVTVPKYQRRLDGLSGNVISLCAQGGPARFSSNLAELCGTAVSRETISKITGALLE